MSRAFVFVMAWNALWIGLVALGVLLYLMFNP